MKRFEARLLLNYTTEQLHDILSDVFILVFEDGELVTNAQATLYSSYAWNFHRMYPLTPLLVSHHINTIVKENRLGSETHLTLLGNVMWSVYDHYTSLNQPLIAQVFKYVRNQDGKKVLITEPQEVSEPQFREHLSEMVYKTTNVIYNDLSYRCEADIVSLDITDFLEVSMHPAVQEANDTVEPTQSSIDKTYGVIRTVLLSGKHLPDNALSKASRSKLVSMPQVEQCIGPRGFLTDTDSNIFPKPILRGFFRGLREFHDILIESRSAAKSLIFSKTPLQQAEYFSRRLQLMSQIVRNLHPGDCGSTRYLLWNVRSPQAENSQMNRNGDLKQLVGKVYMDDDGKLKVIKAHHTHLIGRTLKLRMAVHCAHPDPYGICSTCFGELSLSVPERTNIGQMCCTSLAQKSSQNVLSVKHLDGSSVVDGIILEQNERAYVKVAPDDSSYLLADELKDKTVRLVIRQDQAPNITDINIAANVEDLDITRVSELAEIGIHALQPDGTWYPTRIQVNLGRRLSSMTYALLGHIKKVGLGVDINQNYTVDMTGYDWDKPILTLPLKHFNMSDHSRSCLFDNISKLSNRITERTYSVMGTMNLL